MPELPEVETTKLGISPYLLHRSIDRIIIREARLRIPVSSDIYHCSGQQISALSRRGKYLLLHLSNGGTLLIHLGMSGHLRIVNPESPVRKHDHIDLLLTGGKILRYHDPRRFGLWLYSTEPLEKHPLLAHLGPEPLSDDFNGHDLFFKSRQKKQAVKSFIMDSRQVVGVGNIYATESLFYSGIHPKTPAKALSLKQFDCLVQKIKSILTQAIDQGGTTLRDFYAFDGKPGYFALSLQVYNRAGKVCNLCQTKIQSTIITGRSSAYCPNCQPLF